MPDPAATVSEFNRLYYDRRVWAGGTLWLGVVTQKLPSDLWTMQEIIVETRPEILVEAGVSRGGSTLYYAGLFDLLGEGEIIGIDIDLSHVPDWVAAHPRITLLEGSSTGDEVLAAVRERVAGKRVMVTLDSDHSAEHVAGELRAYSPLVSEGCYLVVEDTNLNGHPVRGDFGPGPMEALDEWLAEAPPFVRDPTREKFLATFNPAGYLRRTGAAPEAAAKGAVPATPREAAAAHHPPAPAADPARGLYLDLLAKALAAVGDDAGVPGASALTTTGLHGLEHLRACVETVLSADVPGDLVEAGAGRGGGAIFMRGVLAAHGVTERRTWIADSFREVSLRTVRENFDRFGLLDEQARFLKGWFRDALPKVEGKRWSVVRVDAGTYEATTDALTHLYPGLSRAGYLVVGDYLTNEECRRAVDDFRAAAGVSEDIREIDDAGVFWRRDA